MKSQRLHPARLAGTSLMRLQSDDRLAELAIDGHDAAFTAIVDRYRMPLLRYCAGIVGASRAEDAVQQVLLNAHDAFTRTDDVRHLRSWLYRIAHNTSLNVLRAVRDDVPLDAAQAAVTNGPAAAFEQAERLRATLDAVRELPERQRAALVLRELEGRSHEEIADALGVTKGSARQHLMRARTAVRGAVTAITPYPLIAKLAEVASSPAAGAWTDAAVGAGAGATVMKLTAGVMATGALVGGAVGTDQVIHHRQHRAEAASTQTTRTAHAQRVRAAAAPETATAENTALTLPATPAPAATKGTGGSSGRDTGASRDTRRAGDDDGRHRGAAVGGGSGSSGAGSDDDDSGDGRNNATGKGSGGAGESGKGSSGSGKDDDRERSDSGTSGRRRERSGTSVGGSGSGSSDDVSAISDRLPESSGSGSDDHDAESPATEDSAPSTGTTTTSAGDHASDGDSLTSGGDGASGSSSGKSSDD